MSTSTVVAAVAVASIVVENSANNADAANKPDDFIESPPRRGKKQKQHFINKQASPTKPSTSPPRNKQPKRVLCFWEHCPFPYIGQMIKECSKEGCAATMHEQCLYEFENDIGYDDDAGKVEDTYYYIVT